MAAVSTIVAAAGVAVAAGGVVASQDASRKALHAQQDATKAGQIDIDALDQQTRAIARQNALDARALENQLTPEVPKLRTAANEGVLNSLGEDADVTKARQNVAESGGLLNTPLLNAAIAKAKADLSLGGKLSVDQQNAATRSGAAAAGAAGGGLGLGRDLAARDLGMSSFQVEQQRLQNASKLGGQELDLATNNSTNLLNTLQSLRSASDSNFNRYLSAAQYGQSIPQPVVGLDPTAIANLKTGNATNASASLANQANIQGRQGQAYLNAAGQIGGALLAYNRSTAPNVGQATGTLGGAANSVPTYDW